MASLSAAFTDFGTLGRVDNVIRACTPTILRQGQFRVPRLRRPQLRLEVAVRPASDRSGPARSSRPATTGRRSSTSPLEQDSKTMKKTPSRDRARHCRRPRPRWPPIRRRPPHAATNSGDRPPGHLALLQGRPGCRPPDPGAMATRPRPRSPASKRRCRPRRSSCSSRSPSSRPTPRPRRSRPSRPSRPACRRPRKERSRRSRAASWRRSRPSPRRWARSCRASCSSAAPT